MDWAFSLGDFLQNNLVALTDSLSTESGVQHAFASSRVTRLGEFSPLG
jgi:hypothetical protein